MQQEKSGALVQVMLQLVVKTLVNKWLIMVMVIMIYEWQAAAMVIKW